MYKGEEKEEIRIVKGVVSCETGKAQLLESSGLYSNYYVNVKSCFPMLMTITILFSH